MCIEVHSSFFNSHVGISKTEADNRNEGHKIKDKRVYAERFY